MQELPYFFSTFKNMFTGIFGLDCDSVLWAFSDGHLASKNKTSYNLYLSEMQVY